MRTQFRYSRASFRRSVVTALGLTLIVSFLVWLFARLLGLAQTNTVTAVSALLFFGFCSAAMIWRYLRDDVVLAFQPIGLLDRRYGPEPVPWEEIKEIRLGRAENEFSIIVARWPHGQNEGDAQAPITIDLEPLDADIETILNALAQYKPISLADL